MTKSFIPCCTNLFTIHVLEDGSILKLRVHAFEVKYIPGTARPGFSNISYLDPLIIEDDSLGSASEDDNFVGLVDDTVTEEQIQERAHEKLEYMKKAEDQRRGNKAGEG